MLLTQFHVLSVAPFNVIPPPSAVVLVGVSTFPNSIFLSFTVIVVELTVVVVPLTVKLPAIVTDPVLSIVTTVANVLAVVPVVEVGAVWK